MTSTQALTSVGNTRKRRTTVAKSRHERRRQIRGWITTGVMSIVTLVILAPILNIIILSLQGPQSFDGGVTWTFDNFIEIFADTPVLTYLSNSLMVTLGTTVFAVVIGAMAGYPLSRLKTRFARGYSLTLFIVQGLPVIVIVIPLFVVFAAIGLADTLSGVAIIFIAGSMAVTCWMMAAYYDSIPIELEEAAWVDGASVFGGFVRIVLRNSLPGILSAAIFSFLVAWNDYLVAVVFLRSEENYTLAIGLQYFFQQNSTDWGPVMAMSVIMLLPPVIIFALLNRYFSIGGVGGAIK
ncbi:carbohydrate ABC transporter permease [Microbacterium sp. R86528]|uniref:carbohydrate ABC transporter permease n=1 Tax=Microbacterium sp. R86528 TaxID=3093864 RepID=UPI0037C88610